MNLSKGGCILLVLAAGALLTLVAMILATQPVRAAGPWYVTPDGDDGNDCLSPGAPCATINGALGKASSGDTIYVAVGTYTGTGDEVVLVDRDATLSGGWDASFTVQSGNSTIDGENSRRGMTVNSGVTATVDRFAIQNGYTGGHGGGVYNGGILTLTSSTISDNTATLLGGGIQGTGGSSTVIMDSQIYGNTAQWDQGGGISADGGDVHLVNSWIVGNAAENNEGGGVSVGGGGSFYGENCIIAGNYAGTSAGGLWLYMDGPFHLVNCDVVGNDTANEGGALATAFSSQIEITNTLIITNGGNTGIADRDGSGSVFLLNYCDTYGNSPDGTAGVTINRTNCLGTPPEDGLDPLMAGGALPAGVGPAFADEWMSYSYRLQAGSPAIDVGTPGGAPPTDIEGNPRDALPDMGAYELVSGVRISPPAQTNNGARGEVVAHEAMVINDTGATDTFDLVLGSHVWDTSLSADSLGPIETGASAPFTVFVTVPLGVDWYSIDTVSVTATSVTSPTVYSDTASFTTEAYAPPQVSVTPDVLTSTQNVGEVAIETLTIDNGNGVPLEFEVVPQGGLPVQEGLVSWWPGEGDAADIADGNDGTLQGGTGFAAGKVGQAFSFDGMDDRVNVGSAANLHVSADEFTIVAWVKFASDDPWPTGDDMSIADKMSDLGVNGDGWRLFRQRDFGNLLFCLGGGGDNGCDHWAPTPPTTVMATTIAQKDVWYHVAGVLSSSEISIYVNGVLEDSKPRPAFTDSNSTDLLIGANAPEGAYLDGFVDEVALFNRALTEAEIQTMFNWQGGIDAPWLSTDPTAGTVTANSSVPVEVTFDANGLQPDTYTADLIVQSNDPVTPSVSIPVTMTVLPTANMGWVEGTVTDAGTGDPLEATIITLEQPYTITTDPDTGAYIFWLDEGSYTLQVAAEGYVTATADVDIVAQQGTTQDFALVLNVPVLELSYEDMHVTQEVGEMATRLMTITNAGPAPLEFEIGGGSGVSFFAASTELYGYDVPDGWLRVVGTEDDTQVQVIDLDTGAVIDENTDLDRYGTWDVYPNDGTFYKVESDKPVLGYESDQEDHSTFIPSLDSGPVGSEFIFYYHHGAYFYVFAVQNATVEVYDSSGGLVASHTMSAGEYWDLALSNAVYHVISTGRIAMQNVGSDGYTTVPSIQGNGVGHRFYFATYEAAAWHPAAFAVFAYQDADVDVYDLDSGSLLYSQHVNQGEYWWQADIGTWRLRLESTGMVEVWAGSTQDGNNIENLGDDVSFAGGDGAREYYLHSLMDGSVIFAPFDNTQVDVDGDVYDLNKDEYLHLEGCCYFRHIQSNQPILIQTLGRDGWWDNLGTYLGGLLAGGGGLPPWLTTDPISGTVPAYSSMPIQVTFDASDLQPDTYTTKIVIQSNDPITPLVSVPVTMTVEPTASMGWVEGTVSDSETGEPLEATIVAFGQPYTITTDPDTGGYTFWLDEGSHTLQVTSERYVTQTVEVEIAAQQGTTQDFALVPVLWYVAPGGDDTNDCQTPTTPCATINGALAKPGFAISDSVLVAIGTYTGTGDEVVLIDKDATLSGGWDEAFTTQEGMSTIDGQQVRRGIRVDTDVSAVVERFTVQNGLAEDWGSGGGISNSGTLTLNHCIVTGNRTTAGRGGGIGNGGTLILNSSAVSGNTSGFTGGGIVNTYGTLILNNSTVSGNTATNNTNGGGIYNYATMSLYNSTVSGNSAHSGGGICSDSGSAILRNTILAGNTTTWIGPDCTGSISSSGYNLIGDTSDCTFAVTTGDLLDVNARLFPMIGLPGYHPLLPRSPAIDAGNPAGCADHLGNPLTTDQRGTPRPLDGDGDGSAICDMGAYEFDPANNPITAVFLPCIARSYCPDFFDDFGNPASGWDVVDDSHVRTEYLNGEYRVLTKQSGYFYLFKAPACDRQNYTVEVDARWAGTPGSSYGLIFGVTGGYGQYYLFDMNTDYKQFRLLRRDPSGFTTVVPITGAPAINGGTASNHLKVTRNGAAITLEVNGTVLGTWYDGTIGGSTGAGLVTNPYDGIPTSDARFDNFSMVTLPGDGAPVPDSDSVTPEGIEFVAPNARRDSMPLDMGW